MLRRPAILVALTMLVGCDFGALEPGGGAASTPVTTLRPQDDTIPCCGPPPPPPDDRTGTLVGRIVLDGPAAKLPDLVPQDSSKVDPSICARDGAIPDESLAVGKDGGVANVFIYLAKKPLRIEAVAPPEQPVLDQSLCIFKPHAVIWRTGVPVRVKNSDAATHNVQMLPSKNASLNHTLSYMTDFTHAWRKAEPQPFPMKCAIHPWMSSYALVVDHPFAAITDEDGRFEIPDLPVGEHLFRVWHERSGILDARLNVVVKPAPEETVLQLEYPVADFDL